MPEIRVNLEKIDEQLAGLLAHQQLYGSRVPLNMFLDPITGAWKCNQCAACCSLVGMIEGGLAGPGFHYDRGDGACIKLEGNLCSIYEDRPTPCRVPKTHNALKMAAACARLYEIQQVRAGNLPPPWEVNDGRAGAVRQDEEHPQESEGARTPGVQREDVAGGSQASGGSDGEGARARAKPGR